MNLKMSLRQVGDVTVIDAAGKMTIGDGAAEFRDQIRSLSAGGRNRILVNLEEVSYIDSSGIGELVAAFTSVSSAGGALKLLKLTRRVQDLLQITKLLTVFETFDDETAAVRSF